MKTEKLIKTALFSVLIIIGAYIRFPLFTVPVTCQSIFVLLAGLVLGAKYGGLSVLLYMALGLLGLPVFSGGGGIGYVLNPAFGFLPGLLVSAYMMGFLSERKAQSSAEIFLCSFVSMVPVYIMGAGYFMLITKFFLKESIDFFYVLNYYALIFIPGDIVKCIIVGLAGAKIRRRI